jgi:hypothetical protein
VRPPTKGELIKWIEEREFHLLTRQYGRWWCRCTALGSSMCSRTGERERENTIERETENGCERVECVK